MANLTITKYAKMVSIGLTKCAKMVNCCCMNIKEIRKQNGLTQKQAALLVGIPYRTYLRYEEDENYINSYKYQKIKEDLTNKLRIDEQTGILSIDMIKKTLLPILSKYKIGFCYLFGSYARGEARENSDIDLLVDTKITGIEFFSLVEEIRNGLHKKIDLLRLADITSDNPIALEILTEGVKLL